MTNEQRMAFLMHLESLIFASKAANTNMMQVRIDPRWAPFIAMGGAGRYFGQGLRGFDVSLRLDGRVRTFRVLEQNPQKRDKSGFNFSQYAVLAQQGHKIVWIIDTTIQPNTFLGRIQDGQFVPSAQRATYTAAPQPTTQAYTGPAYSQSVDTTDLPDVPVDMDIPEYVISSLDGAEVDPSVLADLEIDSAMEDSYYDDIAVDPDLG